MIEALFRHPGIMKMIFSISGPEVIDKNIEVTRLLKSSRIQTLLLYFLPFSLFVSCKFSKYWSNSIKSLIRRQQGMMVDGVDSFKMFW